MQRLSLSLLLGLMAAMPALAQRGAMPPRGGPVVGARESVADVLTRRARVLDDSLGLDDTQEARLRTLLADHLDTLAARAQTRREGRRAGTPGIEPRPSAPGGMDARPRMGRNGRPAPRPGDLDARFEPLFATLDAPVRALLTPAQAARYDTFRSRERARAEALRAAQEARADRRGTRRDAP